MKYLDFDAFPSNNEKIESEEEDRFDDNNTDDDVRDDDGDDQAKDGLSRKDGDGGSS